ncbi:MAG: hypothetical protein K2N09_02255 [Muribaculaceae bacterium]|nr:hypothetical protein [Muribaculaceae bacterium]
MDKEALAALVRITNENLGYEPTTPTGFNDLIRQIQQITGDSLSLSSIKRIWGYIPYDGDFSPTTLNILARYNGIKDWESFKKSLVANTNVDDQSGFHDNAITETSKYRPGDRIELNWNDGKACGLECVGHMRFRVLRAENIKLKTSDIVTLHTLCIGQPVYISDIIRGDMQFTAYVGAKKGGLLSIREFPAAPTQGNA